MAFNDLPKVRLRKDPKPLTGISAQTARKRFAQKCGLKRQLEKALKKCDRDITKYYLTYLTKEGKR